MTTLSAWRPATAYAKGATVCPVAAPGSEPVALDNGDFEAGATGWDLDAGWAISTGDAYEGTYKAIFTGAGSGTIAADGTYPATAGQVIHATVKAKVLDADDGATALLRWYNSSNVLISTSTGLESSVETGVWMQLEVTGTAPANAAYVVFAVEATRSTGASVTIDDARWDYTAPLEARRVGYRAVQEAAGVSGAVEPTWPTVLGDRVNDGTVIWEAVDLSWIEWTAEPIIESGVTEPTWPTTVGAFVRDNTANWECVSRRVEDENCPNTKVVCIINSKVFAADGDIVRFCATANPLDWTSSNDAGYLPTGLQQANANDMAVLYPYRGNLCAWNANCFQMWQTDPDPAQMALLDQMDGIGSTHPLAARAVGNELYFLANQGIRSVGIANAAQNLQAGDVGMPIDVLVQAAMVQAAIDGTKAISTYWPGMGQYWLCFGDDGVTAGAGGALALACPTNISATVGEAYSYTYVATGGTAPYTFSVVSGTLPPGLALDADTGVLSGTITTAGSYSFGVQVEDALGVIAFCGWAAEVLEDEAEILPYAFVAHAPDASPTKAYLGDASGTAWTSFDTSSTNRDPLFLPSLRIEFGGGSSGSKTAIKATDDYGATAPALIATAPNPTTRTVILSSGRQVCANSNLDQLYYTDNGWASYTTVALTVKPLYIAGDDDEFVVIGTTGGSTSRFQLSTDSCATFGAAGTLTKSVGGTQSCTALGYRAGMFAIANNDNIVYTESATFTALEYARNNGGATTGQFSNLFGMSSGAWLGVNAAGVWRSADGKSGWALVSGLPSGWAQADTGGNAVAEFGGVVLILGGRAGGLSILKTADFGVTLSEAYYLAATTTATSISAYGG